MYFFGKCLTYLILLISFLAPVFVTSHCCHGDDLHSANFQYQALQIDSFHVQSIVSADSREENKSNPDSHHKSCVFNHHTCCHQAVSAQSAFIISLIDTTAFILNESFFSVKSPVLDGPFQPPKKS
jgi:hypothetical protein